MNYSKKTKDELVQEIKKLESIISKFNTDSDANQKQNESSKRELNGALYNLIFNQPFLGIVYFDEERTIIDCNDQFVVMIGTPREEILGRNIINFFDNQEMLLSIKDAFTEKISLFEGGYYSNFHSKEKFVKVFFNSYKDEENGVVLGTGFFEDITEKREAEKDVELLANSIQNISECVIITDPQNNILYVNKAFEDVYGYPLKEVLGKSFGILRSLNNPKKINDEVYKSITPKIWQGELFNLKKDGTEFPVFLSTALVKNAKGETYARIGVVRDISQRKKVEKELIEAKLKAEQSDKLKSEFLAQMSHEIRTPINVILNIANMILEDHYFDADEDTKATFSILDSAGKRITRTIDLILNMAEVQVGAYDYTPRRFDLFSDMYNMYYREFSKVSEEKGIDFKWSKTTDNALVTADVYSVSQIFSNLLYNAVKFTNIGEVNVLFSRNSKGNLIVQFIDTGIGIEQDFLPHVFEIFTQEDRGHTRQFEGNGLGLALVKSYCELNKVNIKIESQKSEGTSVTLVFPKTK
ncbi:MAG: PAS domain-containing sensor histidine kinase [Bacteroidota bacterium]